MSRLTFKKAYSISSLTHVALFLLASGMLFKGCGKGNSSNNKDHFANITESIKEIDVETVSQDQLKYGVKQHKEKKTIARKCPKSWYGGIGIVNTFDSLGKAFISSVPKGYPADKANLEIGDELIDGCPKCVGEVGEEVDVQIRKSDGTLTVHHLIREKICTEN